MANLFIEAEKKAQTGGGNLFLAAEEPQVNEWGLPTDLRYEDIPVARKSLTDYPLGMTRQRVEEGPPSEEYVTQAKVDLLRGGGKGALGATPPVALARLFRPGSFPGLKPTEEEMPGARIGAGIVGLGGAMLGHGGAAWGAKALRLPRFLSGPAKGAGSFGAFELGMGSGEGEEGWPLAKRTAIGFGAGAGLGLAGEVGRGIMGARREIAQTGEFGRLMQRAVGREAVPAGAGRPLIPGGAPPAWIEEAAERPLMGGVRPPSRPRRLLREPAGALEAKYQAEGVVPELPKQPLAEVMPAKPTPKPLAKAPEAPAEITLEEFSARVKVREDLAGYEGVRYEVVNTRQGGSGYRGTPEDAVRVAYEKAQTDPDALADFLEMGGRYKGADIRTARPTPGAPEAPVTAAKPPKGITPAEPTGGVFTDAAEAARVRLRARSTESQRGALGFGRRRPRQKGASLTQDLKDYSIIGADIVDGLSRGVRGKAGFNTWSVRMLREFGDDVKPYLRQVWKESNRRWRRETKLGAERGTQRLQRSFPETPVAFRPIDFRKAAVSPELEADLLRVGSYHYGLGRRDFGAWLKAIRPIVGKGAPDDFLRGYFDRVAAGEVPALDIGDKLSTIISDSMLTFEERAAARSKLRGRQLGAIIAGKKGKTGEDAYIGSLQAMKRVGTADFGDLGGVGKQFSQAERHELFERIRISDAWDIHDEWSRRPALDGLATILYEDVIPQPEQLVALDAVFGRGIGEATREIKPWMERLGLGVVDILNARRALMASADVSATLRQGAMLGPTHPVAFKNAFRAQFKVLLSERNMELLQRSITSDPLFRFAKRANLYVAPWGEGATLAAREEIYLSHFADRFPHVRASNRAYVGFLNKLRFDSFKQYYKANPDATPQALEAYARFINYATGRGSLGKFQQAGPTIAAFVFAPRYTLSRPQAIMAMGQGPNEVKVAVAKSLGRWGATVGTVLALADLSPDVDVETDPHSTDFLKVKVGNTRFDLLSGHQQNLRYAAQVASGMVKDRKTGKLKEMPDGWGYGSKAAYIGNFMKSKASPLSTDILEAISKKTFKPGETVDFGDPAYYGRKAYQGLFPMNVQDTVDAVKYTSDEIAVIVAVATILGVGAITYEPD